MPTGSERSVSPAHDDHRNGLSTTENGAAPPSPSSNGQNGQLCGIKMSTTTPDPTPYIQRARVTRPAPPKPSCNPMQFVQIKPCNLYQSAQEQLKKTEEVKKVKEIKKEEPEDWQSNLDNWKSSRRKRVEHIIDRVVEVKKLELEEHDRQRRKSKTFSEMMEERGERRGRNKLASLAVYNEDESNDLSDLGIGTSSASGKSSLSEDYDNHSVMSDNAETEKANFDLDNNSNHDDGNTTRDYISSPGYDTSSSTAPASSPDPCEYTYEGAIQEYKTRVMRVVSNSYTNGFRSTVSSPFSKDSTPERMLTTEPIPFQPRRGSKIEDRLMNFEGKPSPIDGNENAIPQKKDLAKVDVLKRRELFEKEPVVIETTKEVAASQKRMSGDFTTTKSIRDRLSILEKKTEEVKRANRLSGDITSIKDRLQILEKRENSQMDKEKTTKSVDVTVPSLKDRLSSLHSAVTKEEVKKPVLLVDENQLENMKKEDQANQEALALKRNQCESEILIKLPEDDLQIHDESNLDTDREDSGIHTTDVSCSVSQTDEQPELVNIESHHHINEDGLRDVQSQPDEDIKAVPEAITKQIEMEQQQSVDIRDEISPLSPEPFLDLETSVNEALELALQAIDEETTKPNSAAITDIQEIIEQDENQNIVEHSLSSLETEESDDLSISEMNAAVKTLDLFESQEPIYEIIANPDEKYLSDVHEIESRTKEVVSIAAMPVASSDMANKRDLVKTIDESKLINENAIEEEPHYQVPKSSEPYYEVPKYPKPVPVYENIEIFYPGMTNGTDEYLSNMAPPTMLEPPKEKPPPPPISDNDGEFYGNGGNGSVDDTYEIIAQNPSPIKRMNSTKRIKNEIRNKRSSFLGIEGSIDDDSFLELTVAPPPDMVQLLQEERRLEKQLYMKAGLYDSSDTGESRDSGVSENHSRQSSEPFTNSSEEPDRHDDILSTKQKELIEVLVLEEEKQKRSSTNDNWMPMVAEADAKIQSIEHQIREQEEVLRVERELLQLEQEELKRQRENLIIRENLARRELEHGAKMLMSANCHSLQDINASTNVYANIPNQIYQIDTDYRKSMSDLQDFSLKRLPPTPPAKPMRSQISYDGRQMGNGSGGGLVKIATNHPQMQHTESTDDFVPLRNYQTSSSAIHHGNMTRNTLHALSATPKPKYTDGWVQQKKSIDKATIVSSEGRLYQQNRKSLPDGYNYNKHWLIQEAEQRRINDQQRNVRASMPNGWTSNINSNGVVSSNGSHSAIHRNGSSDNKPLPDAIIQTLTQRVQNKGIGERKRLEARSSESLVSLTNQIISPNMINGQTSISQNNSVLPSENSHDKVLSVSGKKKCSHCGDELGRGAAMIIESLRLFFHINCFKCCVCHVQLGDGLNGTDVRVRNHKLHCQNCYSSDDGIKFSCV